MSAIQTQSDGVAQSGVQDQYADGKAAKNWRLYIGEQSGRTTNYKTFLVNLLKEKNCTTIMDAACGTGVDSVMLIEEMGSNPAFNLTSCDFSDKMLKDAFKTRWDRRRERPFFDWVIEEGNWLTLKNDVPVPANGFDAIICMGNSFPNLMDEHGDMRNQKIAIKNFCDMLKPGGILIIDHRNYDYILRHGKSPNKNIYYNSSIYKVVTKTIYEDGKARKVILDYRKKGEEEGNFLLHVQPYMLAEFSSLLKGVFGSTANHKVFGDFQELKDNPDPAFFIHMIEKPARKITMGS